MHMSYIQSVAVLAALSDQLGPHGSVQVSTQYKSSSAAVLAALLDQLGPHGSVQGANTFQNHLQLCK